MRTLSDLGVGVGNLKLKNFKKFKKKKDFFFFILGIVYAILIGYVLL